jgi:hypothetical protein
VRIDPVQLVEQAQPPKTSTERIMEAINRIRDEKIGGDPLAEESIPLIRGQSRNGSPSTGEFDPPDPEPDPE